MTLRALPLSAVLSLWFSTGLCGQAGANLDTLRIAFVGDLNFGRSLAASRPSSRARRRRITTQATEALAPLARPGRAPLLGAAMIGHVPLVALCAATAAAPLAAQLPSVSLDASLGLKAGSQRVALSAWHPVLHIGSRIHLGLGARVSAYAGDSVGYTNRGTVQGNLTATLLIKPAVYALNGAVFGELDLIGPVSAGMNLDVVGLATGPARTAGSLTEKPQALSYFRYGSADHGALNSEFFVAVRVSPRVNVRAGSSHYVTNYEVTDAAAPGATSRYQKFQTVPFVAARLRL